MSRRPLLLVDDEPGICRVLGASLEDMGYVVTTAESGTEALARFEKDPFPQILVTDIKMPGMNGIDLLKAVKKSRPECEVIMVTGHGDIDLAVESLRSGATDFVTKPINDEILSFALRRAEERIDSRRAIREYTEELERLVEQKTRDLVAAERLAAAGQTVADLSHGIKNIAGGLEGGLFVLGKGVELGDQTYIRQGWEMTRDNVRAIKGLSLDLLRFARPPQRQAGPCDLGEIVRDVVGLIASSAWEKEVVVEADIEVELPAVLGDRDDLHKAVLNLVVNGVDACAVKPGKGKVDVHVGAGPEGVRLAVVDNGTGMEDDVLSRLFTRFFTTKGSRGTGIGLMLTKRIVEEHGGRIEVESTPGSGSVFTMILPTS